MDAIPMMHKKLRILIHSNLQVNLFFSFCSCYLVALIYRGIARNARLKIVEYIQESDQSPLHALHSGFKIPPWAMGHGPSTGTTTTGSDLKTALL
jgi:hypothetical protein